MQLDKLLHGGDYNPEQWLDRPDILAKDVELMEKAHVNVVTLGVFSWSTIEPQEGEFHLDWLADIIHPRCAVYAASAWANCTTAARTTVTLRRSTAKKWPSSTANWPSASVMTRP